MILWDVFLYSAAVISAHDDNLETKNHIKKKEEASESCGKMLLCSQRRVGFKYLTALC